MKGIYQVVGSDGVALATIVTETEEQARAAMAEFEAADLIHVLRNDLSDAFGSPVQVSLRQQGDLHRGLEAACCQRQV